MANQYKSKYTGEQIDNLLTKLEQLLDENGNISLNELVASDGTKFKFDITENGQYGYVINDNVIPFNDGKTE